MFRCTVASRPALSLQQYRYAILSLVTLVTLTAFLLVQIPELKAEEMSYGKEFIVDQNERVLNYHAIRFTLRYARKNRTRPNVGLFFRYRNHLSKRLMARMGMSAKESVDMRQMVYAAQSSELLSSSTIDKQMKRYRSYVEDITPMQASFSQAAFQSELEQNPQRAFASLTVQASTSNCNFFCGSNLAVCENGLSSDCFGGWYLNSNQGSNVHTAWGQTNGDGVIIALMGTGVQLDHPDIAANLWSDPRNSFLAGESRHGYNAFASSPPEEWSVTEMPIVGLGTPFAGLMVATGNNNEGLIGVAHGAKLMPLKVHGTDLNSSRQNYIDGFNYILKKKREGNNIRVVVTNYFIGSTVGFDQDIQTLVNEMRNEGILIVGSTIDGSSGTLDNFQSPFRWFPFQYTDENILTIGGYGHTNSFQTFTAQPFVHPSPQLTSTNLMDFHAPADLAVTTTRGSDYTFLIGTGAAKSISAGAAAMLFSLDPSLTPSEVVTLLSENVRQNSVFSATSITGGMLDIGDAVSSIAPQAADYNDDGDVNEEDYQTWNSQFGSNVTPGQGADGNGDGIISAADYTVWRDTLPR